MTICSRCKKHPAVVFISRYEGNQVVNEGLCLKCAYEANIPQISEELKRLNIDEEDIDKFLEMQDANPDMFSVENLGNTINDVLSGNYDAQLFGEENPEGIDDDDFEDEDEENPSNKSVFGMFKKKSKGKKKEKSVLAEFGTDLTQRAIDGKIDNVVGREVEIDRVVQILNRRSKNNPVLIGEPGVGKTAVAYGLALRIAKKEVPEKLLDMRVWELDLTALVAGTQFRGQFEARLKRVIKEAIEAGNIILVIDEVHMIVGVGDSEGSTNAANILKPALARGELRILGATTTKEYRKIEKDSALERRFQKVIVNEPSEETTIDILKGVREYYEKHHNVTYSDEVIEFAVKASKRYIMDRFLPDKAIDLIDEAGSSINLGNTKLVKLNTAIKDKEVIQVLYDQLSDSLANNSIPEEELPTAYEELANTKSDLDKLAEEIEILKSETMPVPVSVEDIAKVIEMWTGIPLKSISETETQKLVNLEARLHERVIGQDKAVNAVSRCVRRNRSGFAKKHKPASFIFVGPTGVGKTELVKALAQAMFDTEDSLIRVDMSEYMEAHSVSKLIGSPPGYVGHDDAGQLTEQVRRKPYSVILFDEIEKAHPDIFNLLLQLLDEGRLTDSHGVKVNFENTIIIMTSNAGSSLKASTIGFTNDTKEALEASVETALKTTFRPEFLNRIDEVVIFSELNKDEIRQIVNIMIKEVFASLKEKGISATISNSACDELAKLGYDPKFGARPLRKTIRAKIEDKLTDIYLEGKLDNVKMLNIDFNGTDFVFDLITGEENVVVAPKSKEKKNV